MRLSFHGAVRSVTVSRHMIETPGFRQLLDCGLFQGPRREEASHRNCELGFDPKLIGSLLLSMPMSTIPARYQCFQNMDSFFSWAFKPSITEEKQVLSLALAIRAEQSKD